MGNKIYLFCKGRLSTGLCGNQKLHRRTVENLPYSIHPQQKSRLTGNLVCGKDWEI